MEAPRWILRQTSLRLRRSDLAGRGTERRVLAEPPVTPADPYDTRGYDTIPAMVKIEFENENADIYPELHVGHTFLQENSLPDAGLNVKEENSLVMKKEDETDEVSIKQELDIEPTMLQLRNMPRSFSPSTSVSSHVASNMTSIFQWKCFPSPPLVLDPCPSTSSAGDAASGSACSVLDKPAQVPQTEVEDDCCEEDFELELKKADDACQRILRQQSYEHFDSEDTSTGPQDDGQCRNFVSNGKTDTTKTTDLCIDKRQNECRYFQYDTMKKLNSNKCINTRRTHLLKKSYTSKRYEYNLNQVGTLRMFKHVNADEKLYQCKQCEYSTPRIDNLKVHMCTHTSEKPYQCEYCEYRASQLRYLKCHMHIHTGERLYKCELCEYRTPRIDNLKVHICTHTSEKTYKCELCKYSTSQVRSLKLHIRTHTGEKPYKCEHCEYSASQIRNLKLHMHNHTGERLYKCEYCKYSTSLISNFKRHMCTHTGKKPYKCEHCEYSASQVRYLKLHIRTHTGERPYKCKSCEHSASELSNLKKHMRTHTGEKPFKCEHCKYKTSQVRYLKTHMRTHTELKYH